MTKKLRVKQCRARPTMHLIGPLIVSWFFGLVMTSADAAEPQADPASVAPSAPAEPRPTYQVQPIGWARKADGRTSIELYEEYRPALLGVDALDSIWVLYWFDRNDTPVLDIKR